MFFPSRARLASWRPVTQRRRNLENSAVPTLLARATHVSPSCYYARAEGDLEACWNKILTVLIRTRFHTVRINHGPGATYHQASFSGLLHPQQQTQLAASPRMPALCHEQT